MCPPVSVRYEEEGMSYLYAFWMYQLQHGDQLSICFTCFKAAFLDLKDLLESEDWEEDNWDPELMEHTDAESEQEGSSGMELSWGQSPGQPAQEGSEAWGLGTLASAPEGSEDAGLDPHVVPTELGPQEAVPLVLGLEDADWTQGLPWRFEGLLTCSHWPSFFPS
ncbi:testis-expressed protein 19 [Rhinopithecus roxellana]|uniref:testis-expressed sequence 19 protein n=1 Tax=Rhinopithecus bieti TaxID=61621 RepID=UPI000533151B|nr:PREDICTED: testis-expressed sequence 19 protein [Rhinopithecus bieti]XP_030779500.1 testis-expressed protein 19 [Rhinopithecus roxellana]